MFIKVVHITKSVSAVLAYETFDPKMWINVSSEVSSLCKSLIASLVFTYKLSFFAVRSNVVKELAEIIENRPTGFMMTIFLVITLQKAKGLCIGVSLLLPVKDEVNREATTVWHGSVKANIFRVEVFPVYCNYFIFITNIVFVHCLLVKDVSRLELWTTSDEVEVLLGDIRPVWLVGEIVLK